MLTPRFRDIARLLPFAILLYLLSSVVFDLLSSHPPFWTSQEGIENLLWKGCFIIPFLLFGLAVAQQRQKGGH